MTAPNMATITESLERSLQNCSLNHERTRSNHNNDGRGGGAGIGGGCGSEEGLIGRSSNSDDNNINNLPINGSDTSLELNSHISLPYHWEQCLDLKTGEIYYINWMNGMKAREDPRTRAEYSGDYYSEEEDEDDDDESSYDSEESQSGTSHCSTRESNKNNNYQRVEKEKEKEKENVLVVAGCKSCLMYFMVPKQGEDCPKCNGQILHFDRSESSSP